MYSRVGSSLMNSSAVHPTNTTENSHSPRLNGSSCLRAPITCQHRRKTRDSTCSWKHRETLNRYNIQCQICGRTMPHNKQSCRVQKCLKFQHHSHSSAIGWAMPFVRSTMEARTKLKPLSCAVNRMNPSTAGKLKTLFLSYFAFSPFLVLHYGLDLLINFSMLSTLLPQELSRCLSRAFCLQLSWAKTHLILLKHTFLSPHFPLNLLLIWFRSLLSVSKHF